MSATSWLDNGSRATGLVLPTLCQITVELLTLRYMRQPVPFCTIPLLSAPRHWGCDFRPFQINGHWKQDAKEGNIILTSWLSRLFVLIQIRRVCVLAQCLLYLNMPNSRGNCDWCNRRKQRSQNTKVTLVKQDIAVDFLLTSAIYSIEWWRLSMVTDAWVNIKTSYILHQPVQQ